MNHEEQLSGQRIMDTTSTGGRLWRFLPTLLLLAVVAWAVCLGATYEPGHPRVGKNYIIGVGTIDLLNEGGLALLAGCSAVYGDDGAERVKHFETLTAGN